MYDNLQNLVDKGEVINRYYNPLNYFDEVHFFLFNQNKVSPLVLKKLTGNAKIYVNTFSIGFIEKILLLCYLAIFSVNLSKIVSYIKKINPHSIRCYNLNYQIFIAEFVRKKLNIPYILSLHYDLYNHLLNKNFLVKFFFNYRVQSALETAYKILPVYKTAARYLKFQNIKNYIICYNFINTLSLASKFKYKKFNKVLNLICTNRQYSEKNPINIIKAVEIIPNIRLTLVGNGSINSELQLYVKNNKLSHKIFFIKSIKNDEYIKFLRNFDVFICNTYANEFSKGMIEAISLGLPIIVNHQPSKVIELSKSFCLINEDSLIGYKKSILKLINDKNLLKKLSMNGRKIYIKRYESSVCEKKFQKIFNRLNTQ